MSQKTLNEENVSLKTLPPIIINNPRAKIEPEQINPNTLLQPLVRKKERPVIDVPTTSFPESAAVQQCPRYPLAIIWSPDRIYFELDTEPVVRKLWIWNGGTRTIYVHCCGLWNDAARLGATWRTYPRTRFHLAPGLKAELSVKAAPKVLSPISCAYMSLQLAASHKRDKVTGFFAVPIAVKFLNYREPVLDGEG